MLETRNAVRTLLSEQFGLRGLSDAAPIFSAGVLDSMDVLQLIIELEQLFGIKVPVFEVSLDTFDSIDAIAAFVNGANRK